jgi:sodium-dependent dicarboxylate transporter 2/3/5
MKRSAPGLVAAGEAPGAVRPTALVLVVVAALVAARLPLGLEPRAHGTLVILTTAAGLWVTEAVPVACTSLLIPVLAVLLHVADSKTAFAGFGDPILFLFLGTFLLTAAAFEHGLQGRLTHAVLRSPRVAQHPRRLLWAVALLGCGLSAWVNNTATTVLILPLALTAEGRGARPLLVGVLLMSAYGPSLGGIATPVGTAPNLIGLRLLEQGTGAQVSFAHWCARFAPLALVSTALATAWFHLLARRGTTPEAAAVTAPAAAAAAEAAPVAAGRWSRAEKTLVPIYLAVVALWIGPGILQATHLRTEPWLVEWSARLPETSVPLLGGLLLFVLPSGRGRGRILDAGVVHRIDWSTLLLFGGGLSLGALMFETGLARVLGERLFAAMPLHGEAGVVLAATLMAVLVSELTSNTASASLVVPVVLALAQAAGVDPVKPALAATVGCSFGFMLPVSTPPNALVYATGRVRIREMVRYGLALDLVGIALVAVWVTLVG